MASRFDRELLRARLEESGQWDRYWQERDRRKKAGQKHWEAEKAAWIAVEPDVIASEGGRGYRWEEPGGNYETPWGRVDDGPVRVSSEGRLILQEMGPGEVKLQPKPTPKVLDGPASGKLVTAADILKKKARKAPVVERQTTVQEDTDFVRSMLGRPDVFDLGRSDCPSDSAFAMLEYARTEEGRKWFYQTMLAKRAAAKDAGTVAGADDTPVGNLLDELRALSDGCRGEVAV